MKLSVPRVLLLLATISTPVLAGDVLERKAGLWKITTQGAAAASKHTAVQCLASDTDARLASRDMATMKAICSKFEAHKVGGTYVIDSVCKIGSRSSISHTVTTLEGDSAYHSVVTTHEGAAESSPGKMFVQDGRWAGQCPSNMKPGDQILDVGPQMPNGLKTNLLDPSPAG